MGREGKTEKFRSKIVQCKNIPIETQSITLAVLPEVIAGLNKQGGKLTKPTLNRALQPAFEAMDHLVRASQHRNISLGLFIRTFCQYFYDQDYFVSTILFRTILLRLQLVLFRQDYFVQDNFIQTVVSTISIALFSLRDSIVRSQDYFVRTVQLVLFCQDFSSSPCSYWLNPYDFLFWVISLGLF